MPAIPVRRSIAGVDVALPVFRVDCTENAANFGRQSNGIPLDFG